MEAQRTTRTGTGPDNRRMIADPFSPAEYPIRIPARGSVDLLPVDRHGDGRRRVGKIDRLWNGELPGVTTIPPDSVSFDLTSPGGLEFDLAGALALSVLAGLNAF